MDAVVGDLFASRLAACAVVASVISSGFVLASAGACKDEATVGVGGGGGAGGAGGAPGCPEEEGPLFTLHLLTEEPRLPDDLELQVSWSAGDEPVVILGEPETYGTVEDNVICVRKLAGDDTTSGAGGGGMGGGAGLAGTTVTTGGEGGAPPSDELLCELWTSGPTLVRLAAVGYQPFEDTLAPATTEGCDRPVPSEVEIQLVTEESEEEQLAPPL